MSSAFIGVHRRLILLFAFLLPYPAFAVSRIDIHVGEIRYSTTQIENISATLDVDGRWQGKAELRQGNLVELAKDFVLPVTVSKGVVQAQAKFSGEGSELKRMNVTATVRDVAFSDNAGLHAGEKIGGHFRLDASHAGECWQWQAEVAWQDGEVFWQPMYFPSAGHMLKARGWLSSDMLAVEEGSADLDGIGQVAIRGQLKLADKSIDNLEVSARGLQADKGYELLAKPFLEKTRLGDLEVAGSADVQASIAAGRLSDFRISLHDFDIEDKAGRFAFYKVNASMPWALNTATSARLSFSGGRLLKLPLGKADLTAKLDGWSLIAPEWNIPVLDGALTLQNVSAALTAGNWAGHFAARVTPISMAEFSHALGWPRMEGKLAATIPLVTYLDRRLTMDGAMQFDVFDGNVVVSNLVLQDALGLAPRLNADISMRNLDMDLLTRTFSFGAMQGRLDGDVSGLEMSAWKPVKFNAGFRSSEGRYPKKISQRAVENISSLGGAGAAAAIQRSFLRFFKEFNYDRIGLSCRLHNGVCIMDGVEKAQAGYVIVKGSGIPAITVMGYNHSVSWGELLERVQRITQGNTKPIIK
jgi:hypothetical protein